MNLETTKCFPSVAITTHLPLVYGGCKLSAWKLLRAQRNFPFKPLYRELCYKYNIFRHVFWLREKRSLWYDRELSFERLQLTVVDEASFKQE